MHIVYSINARGAYKTAMTLYLMLYQVNFFRLLNLYLMILICAARVMACIYAVVIVRHA